MIRASQACAMFLLLVACWCGRASAATEVRAWLDRTSMQLGETVTLNVEVSGDVRAPQPDLSALSADFELLGTQSSSSVNIINGQTTSKLLWAVGLQPRHAGALMIPALDVAGQKTAALTLQVQPAAAADARAGADVYMEAVAEPRSPYVQQQIRFSVKLYFALNFSDGALDDPQADGLVVHKLGQDAFYSADVAGRHYRVWERRYAIVPEKSGTITLPPISFRGHAIDPGDVNSFFSRGRAVSTHSEAITLDVRPRPASSGNDAWLPARSLTLTSEGIADQASARVGEPLTLTLHLQAQGLGFEQLPELKLPKIDGADVYPDKATTQNRDDGEWLYGERERKFAIVPNRAGPLVVPAMSLAWWDTAHDRAASADLGALTLEVEAAAAGARSAPAAAAAVGPAEQRPAAVRALESVAATPAAAESGFWRMIALAALALWAVTLAGALAWLFIRRGRSAAASTAAAVPGKSGALRAAFRDAARRGDWPEAARHLLAWARHTHPQIRNLGALARAVASAEQRSATEQLDRACYSGTPSTHADLGTRLCTAFSGHIDFAVGLRTQRQEILPPLYPLEY